MVGCLDPDASTTYSTMLDVAAVSDKSCDEITVQSKVSDASTVFGKMSDASTTLGKLSDRSTPNVERRLMRLSQYGKMPDAPKRWGQVGEERILGRLL